MNRKWLFLLLLPPSAQAFSPAELQQRKEALTKASQAFTESESELPPCEGMDRASEIALRYEPPRSCEKAQVFYDYIVSFDRSLRDNCRKMSRWLERRLRDPAACAAGPEGGAGIEATRNRLWELKKGMFAHREGERDWGDLPDEVWKALENTEEEKGEFARMDCALPVTIGMQFRKKQLGLANKHYMAADSALGDACVPGDRLSKGAEDYDLVLRYGFSGGPERAPASAPNTR